MWFSNWPSVTLCHAERQCRQPLTDRVRERQLSSSDKLQRHGAAERLADAPHPKPVKAADAHPCLLVGDPLAEHLHVVASLHHRDRSRWSTGLADQLAERLVEGRVGLVCPVGSETQKRILPLCGVAAWIASVRRRGDRMHSRRKRKPREDEGKREEKEIMLQKRPVA